MRLFIAEKPSLARAIADALPGPQTKRRNFIECGRKDVVAWCSGHILELVEPEHYAPQLKAWRIEDLPIVPTKWQLTPVAPDLLKTIKSLLPRATRVVHAGDPDREGQLLVDEVLEFLGYRGPVDRLLISDLNPPAVRKAIEELRTNAQYRGLYEAALARQRADWLFGINLTRLYTILGRASGYDGVLSVGRVQTPLLGLIVRRDLEVEQFQSRNYYVLRATFDSVGNTFSATWQQPDGVGAVVDAVGRLVSREQADAIQKRIAGKSGMVVRRVRDGRSESSPLPYSLPDLQIDAGKRLGLSPKQTLDTCQALYETHRLLTYPRSDCPYLPEGHLGQVSGVLAAVATNVTSLGNLIGKADRSARSRAWSDAKVTAHHAIIPTLVAKAAARLSSSERSIYELVARRYIAQFFPPFEYYESTIELTIEGERFRVQGRQPIAEGWRQILAPAATDEDVATTGRADHQSAGPLPILRDGAAVKAIEISIAERRTTPPKRFTESGLIQAMTGIAHYVEDSKIKKLLRETDGIGTPATQAQIIQTLHERRFVEKRGRQVISTAIGRALVQTLPVATTMPDMTALWEAAMRRIAEGQMSIPAFLDGVVSQLRGLVDGGRALGTLKVPGARPCVAPGCTGSLRRRQGQYGAFWSCSRYPECRQTAREEDARSELPKRVPRSRRKAPIAAPRQEFGHGKRSSRRVPN